MSIRIITDSASDISQELAAKWNIRVLPLRVRFGDEEFLDGVTISTTEFYEKLVETDEIPKTSQIPPYEYEQAFEEAVSAGDKAICFCMSSGVSGSYQSACTAALDYPGKVFVIDTQQFCISEYIIVERAVQLRDQGMSAEEIVGIIKEELKEAHVIAIFSTLEYLKLGGRLSAAAAFAGTLLSIKPVLTIEDGIVKILGKARGSKNCNNLLKESIQKIGIDFSRPVCVGYTGFSNAMLMKYIDDSAEIYGENRDKLELAKVGATIGTYAGPDAIAVAFFEKH
ncbi:MAG: DegV family protein [Oscillospiraceae bacterium]|nr:DegV family protein [Oscillospiraceae bacterium]